jgi:dihydrofolate synthase/folylpolyglutamate synthase
VIKKDLSIIPTIGLDHINFLGNTIAKIATTKLKSIDHTYIFGKNMPKEVFEVEKQILKNKNKIILKDLPLPKNNYPAFLQDNLLLALNVIKYLNLDISNLTLPILKGRMYKYNNIILDVGHNELAAHAIRKEIKQKVILIYNTYKDKDYKKILSILKPIIYEVEIIKINDSRILEIDLLQKTLEELNIRYKYFTKIKSDQKYLVFGSFKVVETLYKILKETN